MCAFFRVLMSHQFFWHVQTLTLPEPRGVNLHHDVLTAVHGTCLTIKERAIKQYRGRLHIEASKSCVMQIKH